MLDLAVIIVSWNVRQLLEECLASVYRSLSVCTSAGKGSGLAASVWVVDNDSADGTPQMVRELFPQARLMANTENLGFAGGNNQAIESALPETPRHLMLLNPDTVVQGRALETLVRFMDRTPNAGMAGARLVDGDGSFQHSGFRFPGLAQILLDLYPLPARLHETRLNGRYPRPWYEADAPPFRIDHPLGAAVMIRREAIATVGLLDTQFFMYCEEIDWAMRIKAAGWDIYCVPAAEIIHLGAQSTSQIKAASFVNLWRSRFRLYRKHTSGLGMCLARWLVQLGMRLRARQADSETLRSAYREARDAWSCG